MRTGRCVIRSQPCNPKPSCNVKPRVIRSRGGCRLRSNRPYGCRAHPRPHHPCSSSSWLGARGPFLTIANLQLPGGSRKKITFAMGHQSSGGYLTPRSPQGRGPLLKAQQWMPPRSGGFAEATLGDGFLKMWLRREPRAGSCVRSDDTNQECIIRQTEDTMTRQPKELEGTCKKFLPYLGTLHVLGTSHTKVRFQHFSCGVRDFYAPSSHSTKRPCDSDNFRFFS